MDEPDDQIEALRRMLEDLREEMHALRDELRDRSSRLDELQSKIQFLEDRRSGGDRPADPGEREAREPESSPGREEPADAPEKPDREPADDRERPDQEAEREEVRPDRGSTPDAEAKDEIPQARPADDRHEEEPDADEPHEDARDRDDREDDEEAPEVPPPLDLGHVATSGTAEAGDETQEPTPDDASDPDEPLTSPSGEHDDRTGVPSIYTNDQEDLAAASAGPAAGGTDEGEPPPDARSGLEQIENWLTGYGYLVIGVVAMLFGTGFLLKLAYDRGWLSAIMSDTHKVIAGTVVGLLLIGAGEYLVRIDRSYFARGIFGLALGWLYFIFYVGFHFYEVFSQTVAGGYMTAVTITGIALSIRHRSRLIAHLSLIGGLLTPWFISTGTGKTVPLYLYLTVLVVGFLALSIWKGWHGLDVTGQVGVYSIFFSWFFKYYAPEEVRAGAVFFWLFYGLFLSSAFIKYRREADGEEGGDLSQFIGYPYTVLPVVCFVLLVLMYQENVPDDLFVAGGGVSMAVLGGSYFFVSAFLSRSGDGMVRKFQYALGLGIVFVGTLLHVHNGVYPVWIVALIVASLYAGFHLVRRWKADPYYTDVVPRTLIAGLTYGALCFWFIDRPPANEVVLPLVALCGLFLVDHATASYRFLVRNEPLTFPVHYGGGVLLLLSAGALLLSGIIPATPEGIRYLFPWFGYGVCAFLLSEHEAFLGDRSRWPRFLVQSLGMIALATATLHQAYVPASGWERILPVSGGFLIAYQAMLDRQDREDDWLIGASAFMVIGCGLFANPDLSDQVVPLQVYGGVLFLSFLRIPHLRMAGGDANVRTQDRMGVWFLFLGILVMQQTFVVDRTAVARYGSWALVYLAMALSGHILWAGAFRYIRVEATIALVFGVFAHFHLLLREAIPAVETWIILFPYLVGIMFAGELLQTGEDRPGTDEDHGGPVLWPAFLYAVPVFAYSLFFLDALFHHNPGLGPGPSGNFFQRPMFHEVMLTAVTALVAAGPIWKKIRWDRNIHGHGIALFQISLLLFYAASFVVAGEFVTVRDWIVPTLLAPVMFGAAYLMSEWRYDDPNQKMLYLINGFLMTTHGLLIGFEHANQTFFLGLDVAVFFTLARIHQWKWIERGCFLTALWGGLHLTWSAYVVQSGRVGEGITFPFVVRCIGLASLLVIPYVTHRYSGREENEDLPLDEIVSSVVALGALYLGNLKLFAYFGWEGHRIEQHMNAFMYALSALWGGAGLVYFLTGFLIGYRFLRMFGSLIVLLTTIKVFFFDLNVEMIWRVLSFFTLGALLLLINYVYRRDVQEGKGESEQNDAPPAPDAEE